MPKTKIQKKEALDEIKGKLENAKAAVFTDYSGIGVNDFNNLRAKLDEAGAQVRIVKNSLLRLINKDIDLEGQTAVVYSEENQVGPIKVLFDFRKETQKPTVKLGLLDGKIGSVQLPSGRHRFTKKQVEDFLYASGTNTPQTDNSHINVSNNSSQNVTTPVQDSTQSQSTPSSTNTPQPSQEVSNEDDLEKELEALLESLEDDDETDEVVAEEDIVQVNMEREVVEEPITSQSASSILDMTEEVEKTQTSYLNENDVHYFYCPYNELRTIARIIKKTADDNNKKYAFTMNAGLSLFFPLDPFSIIHFYVEESELEFWKTNLQLRETSQSEANIGVLLSKGSAFENLKDVSGLSVVNKPKLLDNLRANNQSALAERADREMN